MPSLFHKGENASAPESTEDDVHLTTSTDQPTIVLPEPGSDEDLDIAKKLSGAFTSINGASSGYQNYQNSTSLKIVNKSGGFAMRIQRHVR